MIAGHLQIKNDNYYMVLNYTDANGKRRQPWIPTGLPAKGNKRRAEKLLLDTRKSFVPPVVSNPAIFEFEQPTAALAAGAEPAKAAAAVVDKDSAHDPAALPARGAPARRGPRPKGSAPPRRPRQRGCARPDW